MSLYIATIDLFSFTEWVVFYDRQDNHDFVTIELDITWPNEDLHRTSMKFESK